MLLVKTKIDKSTIEGIGLGLFADQFIPKGTKIWEFTPNFDIKYTKEEMDALPEDARNFIQYYNYLSKSSGKYIFSIDNERFLNHSFEPNTYSVYEEGQEEAVSYANRDIQKGEELFDNYSSFDAEYDRYASTMFKK